MCDSCFVPFKLDYAEMKKLATGDFVQSDVISAGGHLWSIRRYPRGKGEMDDDDSDSDDEDEVAADYLAIYLRHMTNARGIKVIFEAFVMDKNSEPSTSHARRFVHFFSSKVSKSLGWSPFLKRRNLESRYVVDGWVTIVCGVIVVPDSDHLTVPPSDIGSQLGRLLDCADDGSDVSFIVHGTTFAAHLAVLAARSPVFKAELFGPMAEASMSHITLEDIAPATFKVFLRFIYTDTLPEDDKLELGDHGDSPVEMYKNLLAVADLYAVDRLKLMCAKKLWDNVSTDTVAETLSYAETHSCAELKTKCIAFFAEDKNFREAVLTDGFVALVQKFPGIIAELRRLKTRGIPFLMPVCCNLLVQVFMYGLCHLVFSYIVKHILYVCDELGNPGSPIFELTFLFAYWCDHSSICLLIPYCCESSRSHGPTSRMLF